MKAGEVNFSEFPEATDSDSFPEKFGAKREFEDVFKNFQEFQDSKSTLKTSVAIYEWILQDSTHRFIINKFTPLFQEINRTKPERGSVKKSLTAKYIFNEIVAAILCSIARHHNMPALGFILLKEYTEDIASGKKMSIFPIIKLNGDKILFDPSRTDADPDEGEVITDKSLVAIAWSLQGNNLCTLGKKTDDIEKYEKAVIESFEYHKKALSMDDKNHIVYTYKGDSMQELARIREKQNKISAAINLFSRSIKNYNKAVNFGGNKYYSTYFNRGRATYFLAHLMEGLVEGKSKTRREHIEKINMLFQESIKSYDKAIELERNYSSSYTNKGLAQEGLALFLIRQKRERSRKDVRKCNRKQQSCNPS